MSLDRPIPPTGASLQKQQQRGKFRTSDRYFLLIGLGGISYLFLIYQSLQLADTSDVNINDTVRGRQSQRRRYPRLGNGTVSANHAANANAFANAYPNATDAHESAIHAGLIPLTKGRYHEYSKQNPGLNPFTELSTNVKRPMKYQNLAKKKKFTKRKEKYLQHLKVLHVAPDELRLPKPIINVGFPKAGTSTIFSFFHCNGLKAQHWLCCDPQNHPGRTKHNMLMSNCMLKNLIAKTPIFDNCGDYDVYTEINGPRHFHENQHRTLLDDGKLLSQTESTSTKLRLFFPQHHQLDAIHQQYPNATLIFNQRSVGAWIDSVQSWDFGLQFQILNEFYGQNSTRFLFENTTNNNSNEDDERLHPAKASSKITADNNKDVWGLKKYKASPFTAKNIRKSLETVYNYHLEFVRYWVARHPSHALIEVDITNEDAGKTLAESFGLNEDCWGHLNKNDDERNGPAANKKKGARGEMAVSAQANAARSNSNGEGASAGNELFKRIKKRRRRTPGIHS
jgi:hypothetical protein